MEFNGFDVSWLGHASVRVVDDGFTVAVDPFSGVAGNFGADVVLVTHGDASHFDLDALEAVETGKTVFVFPEGFEGRDLPFRDVEFLKPGESIHVYGVEIEAVPMYNENHVRGGNGGVGYLFSMKDQSFYVAGDTGLIDEMRDLEGRVDLAFLPIEGEYTMGVDDAVRAAVRIKPGLAVPYHFGKPFFPEKGREAERFCAELKDRSIDAKVMEKEGEEGS